MHMQDFTVLYMSRNNNEQIYVITQIINVTEVYTHLFNHYHMWFREHVIQYTMKIYRQIRGVIYMVPFYSIHYSLGIYI